MEGAGIRAGRRPNIRRGTGDVEGRISGEIVQRGGNHLSVCAVMAGPGALRGEILAIECGGGNCASGRGAGSAQGNGEGAVPACRYGGCAIT